jgi:hypothetical protein
MTAAGKNASILRDKSDAVASRREAELAGGATDPSPLERHGR